MLYVSCSKCGTPTSHKTDLCKDCRTIQCPDCKKVFITLKDPSTLKTVSCTICRQKAKTAREPLTQLIPGTVGC